MQSARQIARLNETELQKCIPPSASWHTDYRDTAYIHIGGLPFELSEGDVLTIFSQYGNPVHVNLVRDKETGKSRGFAFLKYEDQRSCDLAVDNLSGAGVLGRVLAVDHCRYKLKEGEVEGEGMEDDVGEEAADDTDREGEGRRKRRRRSRSESGSEEEESRPMVREELELAKLLKEHDEDDPMKEFLIKEKKEEVADALKRLEVSKKEGSGRERNGERKRRHHRSRRHDSEDEEERREWHRVRREREKDDDRRDGHRSRRTEDGDERREKHRSSREDDADDRGKDHRRSRRDGSEDEHYSRRRDDERRSRRERSAEREPERRNGHDRSRRDDAREDDRQRRD